MLVIGFAPLRAAEGSGYTPESHSSFEIFTSKVLKVYSLQDGGFDYVAYVVTWKDHEVVITPLGMADDAKRFNVGDTVRCQMQQTSLKIGEKTRVRMTFSLLMPSSPMLSGAEGTNELRRIEATTDELARRRAIRESGATIAPQKTKEPIQSEEPIPTSIMPPAAGDTAPAADMVQPSAAK